MSFGFKRLKEVMAILQSLDNWNYKQLSTIYVGPINFTKVVEPFF